MLKRSFLPVVDERTRLLVLGSLPGERSLAQRRYYAHPQNQFWRLMGLVIGTDLAALPYQRKLQALLEARVGLWDVVATARRSGSLDSAIRDHSPNGLVELAASLPELQAIAFNGGKSFALGSKLFPAAGPITLIPLPSSSPAFTRPFEEKAAIWTKLALWLT